MMKNIIASMIPTFNTLESGVDGRLFSNLIKARRRKNIVIPIRMSSKILKTSVSGLPINNLQMNNKAAAMMKS